MTRPSIVFNEKRQQILETAKRFPVFNIRLFGSVLDGSGDIHLGLKSEASSARRYPSRWFLLHRQNQRFISTGLKSRLPDGILTKIR